MKRLYLYLVIIAASAFYIALIQYIFGDNDLIKIKGDLLKTNSYTQLEKTNDKDSTEYACLSFMLKNSNKYYLLKLDITNVYQGFNILQGVNLDMHNAGRIYVWIKKSDFNNVRPKVYRVGADDKIVYERISKPFNFSVFIFICINALLLTFIISKLSLLKRKKSGYYENNQTLINS